MNKARETQMKHEFLCYLYFFNGVMINKGYMSYCWIRLGDNP